MEEFFSSFLRRAGMPASAGLSCLTTLGWYWLISLSHSYFLSLLQAGRQIGSRTARL